MGDCFREDPAGARVCGQLMEGSFGTVSLNTAVGGNGSSRYRRFEVQRFSA